MGRLMRSKTKLQKADAENNSPGGTVKKPRRGKLTCKNIEKIETKPVSKDSPGSSFKNDELQMRQDCKPIYNSQKKSITRKSLKDIEDRLHLYDFEVDENEPVVKKGKRKPILKIKKHRTYKRKFKFLPESAIDLEEGGKENIYHNVKATTSFQKPSTPLAEISNIPFEENLDLSIDAEIPSRRLTLYSPQPYRSPKMDSMTVPVLRTSDCNAQSNNISSRSLDTSASSSKYNNSVHSIDNGSFMNQLFMGSSTPIRSHWAEDCISQRTITQNENFDLSNNFGFDTGNNIDEPFISPIKTCETSLTTASSKSPKKQSPIKVPFKTVIKMLKFGKDAPDSDGDFSFEGLPNDFYHDGSSPTFSSTSIPSTPEDYKMILQKHCPKNRINKKQLVLKEELEDSGNLTQSSEDKESQEKCENVYINKRRNVNRLKKEEDKGYETDQVSNKRQVRRSYERPAYLRSKKKIGPFGLDIEEEDDDPEETTSVKITKKKPGGLSKKEEIEMEKWAKAFNEQCMQVESFNLCVE